MLLLLGLKELSGWAQKRGRCAEEALVSPLLDRHTTTANTRRVRWMVHE